ncbi:MAG: hypothetical protein C4K58_03820 [Flavobacteriaceae bacterium]|nr:MAG: hypothetical protein C4K58_03820 [Flavobacteriaceae bacterium]
MNKLDFQFFDCLEQIPSLYLDELQRQNLFWSKAYLDCYQRSLAIDHSLSFALFFDPKKPKENSLVGIAMFHMVDTENQLPSGGILGFAKHLVSKILVCANLHLAGESGFWFKEDYIELGYKALSKVMEKLAKEKGACYSFIKDLHQKKMGQAQEEVEKWFYKQRFYPFNAQPNMLLDLSRFSGDSIQYFDSLKTKYRSRAKQIMQKAESLDFQEFTAQQIQQNQGVISELFDRILQNSELNFKYYKPDFFARLKEVWPLQTSFRVLVKKGEIIGFSFSILLGKIWRVQSVGFSLELNSTYELYQNLLYDTLNLAINSGREKWILGRTAMEIKSNFGAEPIYFTQLLKSRSLLGGKQTAKLIEKATEEVWTQRKPLKEAN